MNVELIKLLIIYYTNNKYTFLLLHFDSTFVSLFEILFSFDSASIQGELIFGE